MLSMKTLVQEFIFDCQVRNLSPRTIHNYEKQLNYFMRYLKEAQGVEALENLKPLHIKQFVVMLQGKKNKPLCSQLSRDKITSLNTIFFWRFIMVSTNSKNQKIQILRAIAICAVVIIHSYPQNLFGVFIRAFVNFAVSMFFFLSGYLTKLENDNWKQFWIKRIKRVVIPYIIWSVLWTVVTRNFDHFFIKLLTGECVYPYYFVFVYVQFVLFTPLISKLIKSNYNWIGWLFQPIAIILMRYLGLEKIVPFSILFSWFGPYYLGMMLGNRVFQWNCGYKKTTYLWIISLAISMAEGLVWFKAGNYDLATTQLKLSNCLYSAMCILLAYKYINNKDINVKGTITNKIMISLGDYSFGIFLAHAFVILIMKHLPIYKYLVFPINSALVVFITALCVWCGRKILGVKYGKYLGLY